MPMDVLTMLAQSLGVAFASGISPYATVLALGLAGRFGWISQLPAGLEPVTSPWVLAIAGVLTLVEILATLIPGVASAWETAHSVIRPPAAALVAVLAAWGGDPVVLLAAGLLGGTLGLATHLTKLGIRLAIDTSPEPVSNGGATAAEVGVAAGIAIWVWHNPFLALGIALAILVALVLLLRAIYRSIRRWGGSRLARS
jgi:hypothetical protein